jgi:hypothetical protein
MKPSIKSKTATLPLLILFALGCFALSPVAHAKQQSEDRGNGNSAAEEVQALNLNTTGFDNTAHGWFSLLSNTTGSGNTADGFQALFSNTTGFDNTAIGSGALQNNTSGNNNSAIGSNSLASDSTGHDNTALGWNALSANTTNFNTAIGSAALRNNTTGGDVAVGLQALYNNTTGYNNTAIGVATLFSNTTGVQNTALGDGSLGSNTTAYGNTAVGYGALDTNSTGVSNVALGSEAGNSQTTGSNNVYIGANMMGQAGESNACYIASIFGQTSASGVPVFINGNDKLGTQSSSRRFKKEIKPMEKASQAILALKPVTFHYKSDPAGAGPQFGLVAEEVAEINPDLVVRDRNGEIYTVRYDAVNAMLLNEFLKEHRKVKEQEASITQLKSTVTNQDTTITQLKSEMKNLAATVSGQAAQIQKVNAQLKMSQPLPQVVASER